MGLDEDFHPDGEGRISVGGEDFAVILDFASDEGDIAGLASDRSEVDEAARSFSCEEHAFLEEERFIEAIEGGCDESGGFDTA